MSLCPPVDQLQKLLDAALSAAEVEELEAHIAVCSACESRLREMTDDSAAQRWRHLHQRAQELKDARRPHWLRQAAEKGRVVIHAARSESPAGSTVAHFSAARMPDIAGFEVLEEIGRGGMGVVYRARQINLNRPVALKMILDGPLASGDALARIIVEAEAIGRLRHPNFVQIYEIGEHEGRPFIVLEYVDGATLADYLNGRPQPPRHAAAAVESLARAMHHAHSQRIVHRDLKPANIIMEHLQAPVHHDVGTEKGERHPTISSSLSDFRLKITDLGLVKLLDQTGSWSRTSSRAILGSPSYMAPEQARGGSKEIGPLTDVYALGVILHEMLVGQPPFLADTPTNTLLQVVSKEPVSLRRWQPQVPRDLETICLKCLAKEPQRRYWSAEFLANDLLRFLEGTPIEARPTPAWERAWLWARRQPLLAAAMATIGTLLLAVLVALGWAFFASLSRAEEASRRAAAERRQAASERARAEEEAQARVRENVLREETQQVLNHTRVALAEREWLAANVAGARRLLDLCRPKPGQPDLRGWEWYYVDRLCRAELAVLEHPYWVNSVAFSPDGRLLATAAGSPGHGTGDELQDGEVRLYDTETFAALATLTEAPLAAQIHVRFSPDGNLLLARDVTSTWRVWDVESRKLVVEVDADEVAILRDHRTLGLLKRNGEFAHVDLATGDKVRTLYAAFESSDATQPFRVRGGFDSLGSRLVLRPGGSGPLFLVDAFSGEALHEIPLCEELNIGVQVAHQIQRLSDGNHLVDFGTRSQFGIADGTYTHVSVSPNDEWLLQTEYSTATLVRGSDGQVMQRLWGHSGAVNEGVFNPDSSLVATAGTDHTVRLWEVPSGRQTHVLRGHLSGVRSVAFRPDGRRLASAGQDRSVRIWDLARDPHRRIKTSTNDWGEFVTAIAFTEDARKLMWVRNAGDRGLWVHDLATGEETTHRLEVTRSTAMDGADVAFTRDGRLVASVDEANVFSIKLRIIDSGEELRSFSGYSMPVMALAIDATAETVAGLAYDPNTRGDSFWSLRYTKNAPLPRSSELFVWKTYSEGGPRTIPAPPARCLALSEDGKLLATAGFDDKLRIWDLDGSGQTYETKLSGATIVTLTFNREGNLLAAGGVGGTISIWETAGTPSHMVDFNATSIVTGVAFSPDGRRLASTGFDGTVCLWDPWTGRRVFTLRSAAAWRPNEYSYKAHVAFSPDGKRLAANNWDGSISVWETTP